jgi:hypothetical protein
MLSNTEIALIEGCARLIVDGRPTSQIDLTALIESFERGRQDEILDALRNAIEGASLRRLTVRTAAPELFDIEVGGDHLYLVVCFIEYSGGHVTQLTDDMLLLGFGPHEDGVEFPADPA